MPHACIGVDVIVGFPGETEEDFLESYNFIKDLDISYLHVFTYSERPNTLADEMEGIVPVEERRRRNEMLRILSEKKKRAFYSQFLGHRRDVLFEVHKDSNFMTGFTDNYLKIETAIDPSKLNQIATVQLMNINDNGNLDVIVMDIPENAFGFV